MQQYKGRCHCGAIRFEFSVPVIAAGLRCNCSICQRKGALMSAFTLAPSELTIIATPEAISTYEFGSCIAKHHFCSKCGIYPFHQTVRKPGHYRVNLGCLEGIDTSLLPFEVFNGAAIEV